MPLYPDDLTILLEQLRSLTDRMLLLGYEVAGPRAFDRSTLEMLERTGILTPATIDAIQSPSHPTLLEDSFLAGLLFQRLLEAGQDASEWTTDQWHAELQRRPLALSREERAMLDAGARNVGIYCQGLANTLHRDTGALVLEALDEERQHALVGDDEQRRQRLAEMGESVAATAEGRKSVGWLKGEILERIGDGARDVIRIAQTEAQNLFNSGIAKDIADRHGAEARVYKRLSPGACDACQAAYVGDDGQPRVFLLRELIANGNNIGRKQKDWRPTLDAMHPHCSCQIYHLPAGYGFDEDGDAVPVSAIDRDAA